MSKKSFKNEPALQFMSGKAEAGAKTILPDDTDDGPAGGWIEKPVFAPAETKSKRFNMLMRPSLFKHLQKGAKERGISVNEFMHVILEIYVRDEHEA